MLNDKTENVNPAAAPVNTDPAATTDVSKVPAAGEAGVNAVPATNTGTPNAGVNAEPRPQVDFEKRFKDMERKFTKTAQERSAFEKREAELRNTLSQMHQALQQLTKKPIDPQQFLRELETKGPEAFKPFLEEQMKAEKEAAQKEKTEYVARIQALELKHELRDRYDDKETYPDFKKLEPTMNDIYNAEDCPVDRNLPIGELLDALYHEAKLRHTNDAVAAAHADGKKAGEASLAKESATTVAGGGKTAGTAMPNWDAMSAAKIRETMANMGAVADRD